MRWGDEVEEVEKLVAWYEDNNLALNTTKTKEIITDLRRKKVDTHPCPFREAARRDCQTLNSWEST